MVILLQISTKYKPLSERFNYRCQCGANVIVPNSVGKVHSILHIAMLNPWLHTGHNMYWTDPCTRAHIAHGIHSLNGMKWRRKKAIHNLVDFLQKKSHFAHFLLSATIQSKTRELETCLWVARSAENFVQNGRCSVPTKTTTAAKWLSLTTLYKHNIRSLIKRKKAKSRQSSPLELCASEKFPSIQKRRKLENDSQSVGFRTEPKNIN